VANKKINGWIKKNHKIKKRHPKYAIPELQSLTATVVIVFVATSVF
jgi:hypothetical protein